MSDSHLFTMHQTLIAYGNVANSDQHSIEKLEVNIAQDERELRSLEKVATQFKKKNELENELEVYNALDAWKKYYDCRNEQSRLQNLLKEYEKILNQKRQILNPIRMKKNEWKKKERDCERKLDNASLQIKSHSRAINKERNSIIKQNVN